MAQRYLVQKSRDSGWEWTVPPPAVLDLPECSDLPWYWIVVGLNAVGYTYYLATMHTSEHTELTMLCEGDIVRRVDDRLLISTRGRAEDTQ